jgi:hypothetical protein
MNARHSLSSCLVSGFLPAQRCVRVVLKAKKQPLI